ncbi:hypothetical protein G8770_16080 [Aestuariicella hydrocarbonica]|uniref:Uncharacterized protein n=1 Tax=Pseudomaricurvus hydrocarbonicus TaxID=1470433 RepID=A0A9E5T3D3_9GAMM|nr:hypothetical protein [Aestuariicella hydrocarbonica]NHO67068.1 hypothetical protein [Aestuariicella hydrocarbonica]
MEKAKVTAALLKTYEVIYIDKFADAIEAELARASLKERFLLSDRKLELMSCGKPIVVKKGVSYDEACRFDEEIKKSGGICWIQESAPDGLYHERRSEKRRELSDRRDHYRGSAILPDRRMGIGRRTSDKGH